MKIFGVSVGDLFVCKDRLIDWVPIDNTVLSVSQPLLAAIRNRGAALSGEIGGAEE